MNQLNKPPGLAKWLFKLLFPDKGQHTTVGDLDEVFHQLVSEDRAQARFWYWRQTVRAIPSYFNHLVYWSTVMLRNYLTISLRNLVKDKWYSSINFGGLIVGLTCFSLMMLFVQHEFSYDDMHANADRIYRFIQILDEPGEAIHEAGSPIHLAAALVTDFPEVEQATHIFRGMPSLVRFESKAFVEEEFLLSNQAFFDIFDIDFVQGNALAALERPHSVVITEEVADRYFSGSNPIGKSLSFSRYGDFNVTAVVKRLPPNSSLQFNMLLSESFDIYMQNVHPNYPARFNSWHGRPATTYALFKEGTSIPNFEAKLPAFLQKYRDPNRPQTRFYVQNLRDTHFHSANIRRTFGRLGDLTQVSFFAALGVFILLVACINYTNLATARSAQRTQEVGMRLAVGAKPSQIAFQFFGESAVLAMLALLPSLFLLATLLPYFNNLTQLPLTLDGPALFHLVLTMLPVTLAVGLLSGSYPTLFLARLKPVAVLRGVRSMSPGSRSFLKRGLVVFQFGISIVLIAATIVIQRQLKFMSEKDLGFAGDQVMVIEINDGNVRNNFQTIKHEFLKNPNVLQVSGMSRVVSGYRTPPQIEVVVEPDTDREPFALDFYGMDEDGIEALGLEIVQGRNFSDHATENQNVILLNETAAQRLAVESPLGKNLFAAHDDYRVEVVGVVKDFHYRSLHEAIRPMAIGYLSNPVQSIDDILVKVRPRRIPETIAALQEMFGRWDSGLGMDYRFLDEMVDQHYRSEQAFRKVFGIAAGLAIFIACLGLVGLAAFAAERRIKEFGIRRVLGASATRIITLQLTEFLKLVAVANLVAWPIAWLLADHWLQNFSYRVAVEWDVYFISGFAVLLIATLTVSAVALRATQLNPVESLRSE